MLNLGQQKKISPGSKFLMECHSSHKFQLFSSLALNQTEECITPYVLQEPVCVDRAPHESFAKNTGIELSTDMLYILNHEIIFLLFPWFSYSFLTHWTTKGRNFCTSQSWHAPRSFLCMVWTTSKRKKNAAAQLKMFITHVLQTVMIFSFWAVFTLYNTKHFFKELETYVQYKQHYQMIETLSIGSLFLKRPKKTE